VGGLIAGGIIYLWIGNITGLVLGILIAALGLTTGIIMANRVWKRKAPLTLWPGKGKS
jgi:hypothetical protein